MDKILIRHKGQVYKFLNYEFQDGRDGSLYIVFDGLGKGQGINWGSRTGNIPATYEKEDEKFKISYHPCGHVRFHNIGGSPKSIHCEPIYAITKKQPLAFISIPNIESLTSTEEIENKDTIYDWPEDTTDRVTFWIELGPPNLENPFNLNNLPLAAVTPMRVPPELTVEFFDADLSAEVTHCTTYEVRFKVKGRGGYKNDWAPIKGFTLDAEL
jgi:hypothetical protein